MTHYSAFDVRELARRQDQIDLLAGRRMRYMERYNTLKDRVASACEQIRLNQMRSTHVYPHLLEEDIDRLNAFVEEFFAVAQALYDCEEHLVDMRQLEWKDTTYRTNPYETEGTAKMKELSNGVVRRRRSYVAAPQAEEGPQPDGAG